MARPSVADAGGGGVRFCIHWASGVPAGRLSAVPPPRSASRCRQLAIHARRVPPCHPAKPASPSSASSPWHIIIPPCLRPPPPLLSLQLSADLALHQGDFLAHYQAYLTQLAGFFLVEDAVQAAAAGAAGEPLDIVAQVGGCLKRAGPHPRGGLLCLLSLPCCACCASFPAPAACSAMQR